MTTTTKNAVGEVQSQVLAAIHKSQEAAIDAMRGWTETVERFVPETPAWPKSDQLPTPAEIVDNVFDFTAEVLKAQREFAHKVLEVTAPVTERTKAETGKAARSPK